MAAASYWRPTAQRVVRETIDRVGTADAKALRRALKEAYPFGMRRYWPYLVWRDEIKRQLGLKRPIRPRQPEDPDQLTLTL